MLKCQAARSGDRSVAAYPIKQENKIHAAIGGGLFNVDVLPDGASRYSRIRGSEYIDESRLVLPSGEDRGLLSGVQVAHEDRSSRSSMLTDQLSDALKLAFVSFRSVGGKDLDRTVGCIDLGAQQNAGVEPMSAPGQVVDFRGDDRVSAQDGRSLFESHDRNNQPIQGVDAEDAFGCWGEHHLVPEGIRDPSWYVAMPPALRRLLKGDDIRLQTLQLS